MKNNSKTFIWVTTALLVILITPQLYIDYQFTEPASGLLLSRKDVADLVRKRNPNYWKNFTDEQIIRSTEEHEPDITKYVEPLKPLGQRFYFQYGHSASANFWERFEAQLNWQFEKIYGGQFFPWKSFENREKDRGYAFEVYKSNVRMNTDLQAYVAWKDDKPQTNDFATFLRTLSESFPSLLIIGFPLFLLSMFNFFFISKNDMNEIIKKYGFDKKGFSKFNFEVKGIVGSFFKFFIYWYLISKSIFIAGIEIIGISRKQKKSLKPQEIELKNNAKTLILTFMQAEGVILLATFSYFVFQSN
jgi:hypothetical protein